MNEPPSTKRGIRVRNSDELIEQWIVTMIKMEYDTLLGVITG